MTVPAGKPASGGSPGGALVGRYALHAPIASGGMAIVHLGRLHGTVGFGWTVAIKRVHPNLAHDRDFVVMFVDEARLAARIHHPNVVPTLDVVVEGGEVLLVMEYIHGESLAGLFKRARNTSTPVPVSVCSAILVGVLHGLHAAHEARDEQGQPLGIVHRDVSPQNVLVGADGVARVLDFGVAKAAGRLHTTREGNIKGKLSYMAPEQLLRKPLTRRSDVYAVAVVGWELLTGQRLFQAESEGETVQRITTGDFVTPSKLAPHVPPELDAILTRALSLDPSARFETARDMALALETQVPPALPSEVANLVEALAGDKLRERTAAIAAMESGTTRDVGEISASLSGVIAGGAAPAGDPGTQSQLSVFSDTSPSTERGRRLRFTLTGVAVAVVVAGAAFVAVRETRARLPATADLPSATALPPAPSAPAPSASASSVAADATASAASSAIRPTAPGRPSPHGSPSKPGCNPPYTVDDIGRRIYKRECF
jgi:eukaryotic-like serine/threonine-protein kinase